MAAPGVFGTQGWTTHSGYLFGPLVVVVAVIAMTEVARAPRHLTITLGAWVVIAPWLLSGAEPAALANNAITDLALIALSLPRAPDVINHASTGDGRPGGRSRFPTRGQNHATR